MRKLALCALALVLALVAAIPASAQVEIPQIQVFGLPGDYDPYYGPGYHRSGVNRFLHAVFGPEPYYPYGTRPYGYDEETAGKCFERVAKAAKKQKVDITAPEIAAFCSGQPLPQSASEAPSVREEREERMSEPPPAFTKHTVPRSLAEVWVNRTNCAFRVKDANDTAWTTIAADKAVRVEDPKTATYQTQCASGVVNFNHQDNSIVLTCK